MGAVALCLEHQTLNRENPVLNALAAISKLGQFRLPHIVPVHSAVNEYQ